MFWKAGFSPPKRAAHSGKGCSKARLSGVPYLDEALGEQRGVNAARHLRSERHRAVPAAEPPAPPQAVHLRAAHGHRQRQQQQQQQQRGATHDYSREQRVGAVLPRKEGREGKGRQDGGAAEGAAARLRAGPAGSGGGAVLGLSARDNGRAALPPRLSQGAAPARRPRGALVFFFSSKRQGGTAITGALMRFRLTQMQQMHSGL